MHVLCIVRKTSLRGWVELLSTHNLYTAFFLDIILGFICVFSIPLASTGLVDRLDGARCLSVHTGWLYIMNTCFPVVFKPRSASSAFPNQRISCPREARSCRLIQGRNLRWSTPHATLDVQIQNGIAIRYDLASCAASTMLFALPQDGMQDSG